MFCHWPDALSKKTDNSRYGKSPQLAPKTRELGRVSKHFNIAYQLILIRPCEREGIVDGARALCIFGRHDHLLNLHMSEISVKYLTLRLQQNRYNTSCLVEVGVDFIQLKLINPRGADGLIFVANPLGLAIAWGAVLDHAWVRGHVLWFPASSVGRTPRLQLKKGMAMVSNKLVSFGIKPRLAEQLRAALANVLGTSTPAIVLRDQHENTIVGVVVPPEEYELLMATYKLVKSPDGPAKIAGTFPYRERLPEAVLLEEALQSHR